MRLRERNIAWVAVMGVMVGIAIISGGLSLGVSAMLMGAFGAAAAASLIELRPARLRLIEKVPRSPLVGRRMSPQAREAVERARRRGGYIDPTLTLMDVGLITSQSGHDGVVMRRTRTVSPDDDGVRPFITLYVEPEGADRHALLRFEIIDHNGQQQYVHEMKTYLRDGQMNILADHHLPLIGNERIHGGGEWDLRVVVDGALVGAFSFAMNPSLTEREEHAHYVYGDAQQPPRRPHLEIDEEEAPMSLEDLLRGQERNNRNSR